MSKERPINGDEEDWCSRRWRRLLRVFDNRTGLGKAVKRAMNRRARRKAKLDLNIENSDEQEYSDG
jgi:hypothetical protein